MSKKRKTRKEKEQSSRRHNYKTTLISQQTTGVSYTLSAKIKTKTKEADINSHPKLDTNLADDRYLKKDITSIFAATGIVLAVDILLYVLLSTGTIHLNFLGY